MFSICKSSFPASILEKSRISFTIPNKEWADWLTVIICFSWISSSLVFSNRSVKPIIPFKGVLISWLILPKILIWPCWLLQHIQDGIFSYFSFSYIQHYTLDIRNFTIVNYGISKLLYPNNCSTFIYDTVR
jgi:hypothetical protein